MIPRACLRLLLASWLGLGAGCPSSPATSGDGGTPARAPEPVATRAQAPHPTSAPSPRAAAEVGADILRLEAGSFEVGSAPGIPGRVPQRDAALTVVELPAFHIDRQPRHDAAVRSRGEAAARCASEGRRLCGELEWERACKAAGEDFLVSGAEWTASDGGPEFGPNPTVILRGEAPDDGLRCAARRAILGDSRPRDLAFRCCDGAAADLRYPSPTRLPTFRPRQVTVEELRAVLARVPELASIASDFRPFGRDEASRALTRCRGVAADLHGWELVDGVMEWAPTYGPPNWVFAGRSGDDAWVIVLHRRGETFRHAASYVYRGEPESVALTFTPPSPRLLHFTRSAGCVAEGGAIAAEEDGRVEVYHRRVDW